MQFNNYRKKDALISEGKIKLADLDEEDIGPQPDGMPGLSARERQWLQVERSVSKDHSSWLDRDRLEAEMAGWVYPLHMIDFETSQLALPFNRGRKP